MIFKANTNFGTVLLSAVAALTLTASAAFASGPEVELGLDDPHVAAPKMSSTYVRDWSGPSLTFFGYTAEGGAGIDDSFWKFHSEFPIKEDFSLDGSGFGGIIGYDFQIGSNFILGAQYVAMGGELTGNGGSVDYHKHWRSLESDVSANLSDQMALRVRAGYAHESWMLYGAVGQGQAQATVDGQFSVPYIDNFANFTGEGKVDGLHLAIGGEYAITENIALMAEVAMTDYGSVTTGPVNVYYDILESDPVTVDIDAVTDVKFGVKFRF